MKSQVEGWIAAPFNKKATSLNEGINGSTIYRCFHLDGGSISAYPLSTVPYLNNLI